MKTLFLVAFALIISGVVPGQTNLVTNGDFDAGNSNGWTFAGYTLGAKVDMFDTTGIGSSHCFNNRPGGQVTPGPYPPNSMEQNVLVVQGLEYLFTCDLAVSRLSNVNNADGGTVEVFVDGVRITGHAFGTYTAGTVERERLCVRFMPSATGAKALKITFHRRFLTSTSVTNPTPTVYIDNISLLMDPSLPVLCPRGERKIGGTLDLEVSGTPHARFGLFVAPARLATGVAIPGLGGLWWLGNPLLIVAIGLPLDANGKHNLVLPIPNLAGLAGMPFHWQGIQATGATASIGAPARFGAY